MKEMMSKRGLSTIIATVLLLLLTIAAVAIVASFIIPFARDRPMKATECIPYQGYFKFEEVFKLGGQEYRYNCYYSNPPNSLQGVSVKAGADNDTSQNIAGFNLVFAVKGGEGVTVNVVNGKSFPDFKMLRSSFGNQVNITKSGETRTYVFNAGKKYDIIKIYPVLKSGRICDESDKIEIGVCDGNVIGDLTA